jgi:DNA-binding SARP family transcriptional activator
MPAQLDIKLFGDFSMQVDGRAHGKIDTARLQSLLAFLLLKSGTPQSRAKLAFLFWPDSSEKQALTNLRRLLHDLRKSLPDADTFIQSGTRNLIWCSDAPYSVDVARFEAAVEAGQHEQAIELYTGDLLPGHYEPWLDSYREDLRERYAAALGEMITESEKDRDYATAIRAAEKLRQFDPACETNHATLMRLHALNGDRAKALEAYQTCVSTLRKELDVPPSEGTSALHRQLLRNETLLPVSRSSGPAEAGSELPLQGRQIEWKQLSETWMEAKSGRAHLTVLIGEAGIGKTRLAEELLVSLQRQGIAVSRTRSYAAEGRLAYAPVCQWLRSPVLRPLLSSLEPVWLSEIARVIPELKAEFPDLPAPSAESEHSRRHLLFEALSRATTARTEPFMLLLDDMQWTDQETIEWLRFFLHFAPKAPLLITGTIREEEFSSDHPLRALLLDLEREGQITKIPLGPISPEESALIAASVAGRDLSAEEADQLYATTSGNPLFVVESIRAGLSGGSLDASRTPVKLELSGRLPTKVHAVFTTRLAQLSPAALELCRIAAVLGRAFTFEMLIDMSAKPDEESIATLLEELWERRIIREVEPGVYDFNHDKLREVSYAQISTPKRRLLHRRASQVLERAFADDLDIVVAQLASHHEESGQISNAIKAYHQAAGMAKNLNADREAIRLFHKALELLRALPASTERLEQELVLNTELGTCEVAEYGYQAGNVERLYERSREICAQLGRPTAAPILRGLALLNLSNGKLHRTLAVGEELGRHHEVNPDPVLYVENRYVLGVANFWLGRFAAAREDLEASLDHYDPASSPVHIALYAQDPQVVCLARLSFCQFFQGQSDLARQTANRALDLARAINHPHTLGYALFFHAQIGVACREFDLTADTFTELKHLATNRQLPFWSCRSGILKGYVQVARDRDPEGLTVMQRHFDEFLELKHLILLTQKQALFADAHLMLGQPELGLQRLESHPELLASTDERFFDVERLRLRGELLLAIGGQDDVAEQCFRDALQLARDQETLHYELRAARSLGLRLYERGETTEAISTLHGVYNRFKEGLSHPDLKEAAELLENWKMGKKRQK